MVLISRCSLCIPVTFLTFALSRVVHSAGNDQNRHPMSDAFHAKLRLAAGNQPISEAVLAFRDLYGEFREALRWRVKELQQSDSKGLYAWANNVSVDCIRDVEEIITGLLSRQAWAMQFVDATAKAESGIFHGNIVWLGSFDECRNITSSNPTGSTTQIRGKYCLASVGPIVNISDNPTLADIFGARGVESVRLGLCYPDTCTDHDTYQIVANLLTLTPLTRSLNIYDSACQPRDVPYDTKAIVVLTIGLIFVGTVLAATSYDLISSTRRKRKSIVYNTPTSGLTSAYPPIDVHGPGHSTRLDQHGNQTVNVPLDDNDDAPLILAGDSPAYSINDQPRNKPSAIRYGSELLLAFSFHSNARRILNVSRSNESLTCIHGIRFFSIGWIIFAHSYAFTFLNIRNIVVVPEILAQFPSQIIVNASVAVDTFFTISGLLVCYLFVLNYEKTKKIPIVGYYVHRYWRLTAIYAIIMAGYLSLYKYLNTGPQWRPEGLEVDGCRGTWWINLLYLNNFVKTEKQCMGWTWYLANDWQFYCISPLILVPLVKLRKPAVGLAILGSFLVANIVTSAALSAHYGLPASLLGNSLSSNNTADSAALLWRYFEDYYTKPWCRIGPYAVGMACGYLLAKQRDNKVHIRREVVVGIWMAVAASASAIVFGLYGTINGHPLSIGASATYNALHRIGWALCVCWVIFACVQGYGGFVNTLLSWKPLVALSRVTYVCYLVHIPIMMAYYTGKTETFDFGHLEIIYSFLGTIVLTYAAAFIITVGCESPLLAIEKLVQRSLRNRNSAP
ncbi:hypothetical protein RvY_14721 [Ramazzottius varieornatus]|uniref:Nose resistant-to-fluoxetine protein N-terminal domain-containing protein n=1 Tax=Ramazzottius varieornatus TaxID=947166 RepID=A0A1D1VSB0_RAMVA|nr:hypothetical protein RvY_14721 [Ramazzottius varieornatus]